MAFTHDRLVFDYAYVMDIRLAVKQFLDCPTWNVRSFNNREREREILHEISDERNK
jgi:hypothetical protein